MEDSGVSFQELVPIMDEQKNNPNCKQKLILDCNKELKAFIWAKGAVARETDSGGNLDYVPPRQREGCLL